MARIVRGRYVLVGVVVLLVAAAGTWAGLTLSRRAAGPASAATDSSTNSIKKAQPPPPLQVVSFAPTSSTQNVAGTTPVQVRFSAPLSRTSPLPTLSPPTPGNWTRSAHSTLTFTPTGAFLPSSTVTLTIPGGAHGVQATDGGVLAATVTDTFNVETGSVLRLQQLLALLGYSPLSWTPASTPVPPTDTALQAAAAFNPPAGTFAWANAGWPTQLTSVWVQGTYTLLTKGLVMAFEADHGLPIDGVAGAQVWTTLFQALAQNQVSTGGYTFALASKTPLPETLTVWHNGAVVLQTLANTGIAAAPTVDGTFPVYERLRSQVMQGTNPDGSHYADPVQYVAYFNGGDAVHYIGRSSYGYPQSLGCVELPLAQSATAWSYLAIGSLVTVAG